MSKEQKYAWLRITLVGDVEKNYPEIKKMLKSVSPDVRMYCYENMDGKNGRPHTHWYLEPTKTFTWIRSQLRKYGCCGNKDYMLETCKERMPIKVLAYVLKCEDYRVKGIPDELLEKAKEYDQKVKNEINEKKAKKKNLVSQIEEFVVGRLPRDVTINNLKIDDWVETCLLFYRDNGLMVREFQIISLADTLFLKHGGGIALYSLKRRIMSKIEK